jgi:error-prone DNA polymerase
MYVELHARSAFSFLRASSAPERLAQAAAALGLPALALCDRDGLYGAPRFCNAANELGLRPIIGAELTMEDGAALPVLVENRAGYQNLCRLLTGAHLRAPKGECRVAWSELPDFAGGLFALTGDEQGPLVRSARAFRAKVRGAQAPERTMEQLLRVFGRDRLRVEIQRHLVRGEDSVNTILIRLARAFSVPLLATNGVLHARPEGRPALDVFTCLRHHTHLDAAGRLLAPNGERFLKSGAEMAALFHDLPEAVENTARLAGRLGFTLTDLGYQFPRFPVAAGETMDAVLRRKTLAGARWRYDGALPKKVARQIERELAVIEKLGFAGYFLIVADLVGFCRQNDIMAQGRGSAANSTVCFCLGITAVDPLKYHTLFERFLSEGRKGWPDIDIDLPSGDRREKVIQEVYRRYGPRGAAMTANVITYRGRSAAREIGKALNFPGDLLDRFSNLFAHGDYPHTLELSAQIARAGLPREHPRAPAFASLYSQIYGLPRHLGQHSGGMIICQGQLDAVVPLENASMPGRVVAQWDKDDCQDLGIINWMPSSRSKTPPCPAASSPSGTRTIARTWALSKWTCSAWA